MVWVIILIIIELDHAVEFIAFIIITEFIDIIMELPACFIIIEEQLAFIIKAIISFIIFGFIIFINFSFILYLHPTFLYQEKLNHHHRHHHDHSCFSEDHCIYQINHIYYFTPLFPFKAFAPQFPFF